MGAVESKTSRFDYMRRAVANWAMPPSDLQRLNEIDNSVEGLVLKLQRTQGQLDQLMIDSDVGRYKWMRWNNLAQYDYNPERIQLQDYKKMLNYDNVVAAAFDLIQMGCLMKPWRINHPDDEVADTLTKALNQMRWPNFREAMKEMMKALVYGFSVSEIVFDDFQGGKYWMPRMTNGIKTFDPETIRFYTDDYGNLLKITQLLTTMVSLPVERCVVWTHEREWGNWYGKSLLRAAYKNWFIKDAMLKFANIAYERFGSPLLLGVANNDKDMGTILQAMEHLYARSQSVIRKTGPDDQTDIRVVESKRAEMPFSQYIQYHDNMILRRMIMSTKIFEGGGGTYGPKIQLDLIFMRFEDFRRELTQTIDDFLRIVSDLNWPNEDGVYPTIEFAPLTTMDQNIIVQKIFQAIDKNIIYRGEDWIRGELDLPPIDTKDIPKLEEQAASQKAKPSNDPYNKKPAPNRDPMKLPKNPEKSSLSELQLQLAELQEEVSRLSAAKFEEEDEGESW